MALYKTFFDFASGLSNTIKVPVGTCAALKAHFEKVTDDLDLRVIHYEDNPPHWNRFSPPESIDNDVASEVVFEHNRYIRQLYTDLVKWSINPPEESEELTPEFAASIWYGFSRLNLTYDRWTRDVYVCEMEMLFDVMQGVKANGIEFEETPLTPKQAAAVINLFATYLDNDDVRLALPNGRNYLVTSDDYYWCPKHGAWHYEDTDESIESSDVYCPAEGCDALIAG